MYGVDQTTNYDPRSVAKLKRRAWPIYWRLLGYVFQYKARLTISALLACFVAGSFGAILISAGSVVEYVFQEQTVVEGRIAKLQEKIPDPLDQTAADVVAYLRADKQRAMIWLSGIVLALTLLGGIARFFQEYLAASIATFVTIRLGREMFDNIVRLPLRFFETQTSGEIIARMTNDTFSAGRGLTVVFMKLLREPFKALVFLGIALWISWSLTVIGILTLPFVFLVMVRIGQSVRKRMRRTLERVADLQTIAKESVIGISIVKSFGMEEYVKSLVDREYAKLERQGLKMMRADAAIGPLTEFVMAAGFVVFIVVSANQVIRGDLGLTQLMQLYVALAAMLDPVRKIASVNNAIQSSVASAERVFEFIDLKPDIRDAKDAIELPPLRDRIRFEDVHFSYDGKTEVLRGVVFEVKKGEMVAVVGFSGAGKSTIAKLLPRLYDVTGGAILIDGVDIRQATQASLRSQISIVTQETILFNQSIRANIAAGSTGYSDERIRDAARAAHADIFIERLPYRYDAIIGESGVSLSGGQRQRLAIARALIKDPAILILDEATSSLDSESERAIQQAIEEFVVGRTSIVIAHRLSTIQRADRILVLDQGRIVEEGTHMELMQRPDSIYRRLYEIQFSAPPERAEVGERTDGKHPQAAVEAVY